MLRAALTLPGRRTLGLGVIGFGREQGLTGRATSPTVRDALPDHARARLPALRIARRSGAGRSALGPSCSRRGSAIASTIRRPRRGSAGPRPRATRRAPSAPRLRVAPRRRLGARRRGAAGARGDVPPANDAEPPRSGCPARRLAGVAGAELDLRCAAPDLNFMPSARVEAAQDVVSHATCAGVPMARPAVSRQLPVLRLGLVRPLGSAHAQSSEGERRALRPRAVVPGALRQRHGALLGNPDLRPSAAPTPIVALWIDRVGPRVW